MNQAKRLLPTPPGGGLIGTVLESLIRQQQHSLTPSTAQFTQLASFSSTPLRTTAAAAAASPAIFSACVFERLPLVMPSIPEWEIEHNKWQDDFTTRRLKTLPKEFIEQKKAAEEQVGVGPEARWRPTPIETAADRAGDRRTTRRRVDQRIFLLLHRDGAWEFPHVALEGGETTRSGAERALQEALGEEGFQPYFVGNAPAGHVAMSGGTVFFHRCQLIQGKPALKGDNAKWKDYAWAAKDELSEYITDKDTLELLQKML